MSISACSLSLSLANHTCHPLPFLTGPFESDMKEVFGDVGEALGEQLWTSTRPAASIRAGIVVFVIALFIFWTPVVRC